MSRQAKRNKKGKHAINKRLQETGKLNQTKIQVREKYKKIHALRYTQRPAHVHTRTQVYTETNIYTHAYK